MFLSDILQSKFKLKTSLLKTSHKDQIVIYVKKESLPLFINIVKPYMCPSMYYKLGIKNSIQ